MMRGSIGLVASFIPPAAASGRTAAKTRMPPSRSSPNSHCTAPSSSAHPAITICRNGFAASSWEVSRPFMRSANCPTASRASQAAKSSPALSTTASRLSATAVVTT